MKSIVISAFAAAALTACAAQGGKTAAANATARPAETGKTENTTMCGGYTGQRPLQEQEQQLFRRVTDKLVGVRYTPESVATQVVAGTNYRFVCTAETIAREPETFRAEVTVFRPLPGQGEARITEIRRL